MKQWMLVSSLLGICSALPILPQHAGIPGMGSISLERMRQLGGQNIPNVLPQYASPYSYADPFHHMWGHSLLPSHAFYWMRQRSQPHETQQYEYSMPVHPPPLPSIQTPTQFQQPGIQEQPHYQVTNLIPTRQVQIQQYDVQPQIQQKFPPPEGNQPADPQQQPLPTERQTQQLSTVQERSGTFGQTVYPHLYYLPYVANQGVAPARLGIVSSEEMQGGGFGAPAYQAAGTDPFAMNARFENSPLNQPGDYTVEDDQLGITEQPDVPGGAKAGTNPAARGNSAIPVDGAALPNANSHLLSPAGQSQGLSGVAQATAVPLAPQGAPDSFLPLDAADPTGPLDPTMFPDVYTTNAGNEAGMARVGQDTWRFQEP